MLRIKYFLLCKFVSKTGNNCKLVLAFKQSGNVPCTLYPLSPVTLSPILCFEVLPNCRGVYFTLSLQGYTFSKILPPGEIKKIYIWGQKKKREK